MTYSLDLLFRLDKEYLKGKCDAHVSLKSHAYVDYKNEEYIVISPDCVSLKEFENKIDRLTEELSKIKKEAKRKFAEAQSIREKACIKERNIVQE